MTITLAFRGPRVDAARAAVNEARLEVKSAAAEGKEFALQSYQNLVTQLNKLSDKDLALQGQRATLLTGGQRFLGS